MPLACVDSKELASLGLVEDMLNPESILQMKGQI